MATWIAHLRVAEKLLNKGYIVVTSQKGLLQDKLNILEIIILEKMKKLKIILYLTKKDMDRFIEEATKVIEERLSVIN